MAYDTASVFRDQRHRQNVGLAQSLNNELFGVTAVWVRQEGQARDFTNGGFVGWAFWAESDCHWFKRANGLALTGARHSCARPG
jgi:hypothetical protein